MDGSNIRTSGPKSGAMGTLEWDDPETVSESETPQPHSTNTTITAPKDIRFI
jgi:hypothetical protein